MVPVWIGLPHRSRKSAVQARSVDRVFRRDPLFLSNEAPLEILLVSGAGCKGCSGYQVLSLMC